MSSGGTKPKLPTGSPPSAVAIPTYRQVKLLIAELQPAKAKVMIPQLRSVRRFFLRFESAHWFLDHTNVW
jgi:hypothetical protein